MLKLLILAASLFMVLQLQSIGLHLNSIDCKLHGANCHSDKLEPELPGHGPFTLKN